MADVLRALGIGWALAARGGGCRQHQRTTSPFVPWPPRPAFEEIS